MQGHNTEHQAKQKKLRNSQELRNSWTGLFL